MSYLTDHYEPSGVSAIHRVEPSAAVDGGTYLRLEGRNLHLTREDTLCLIADLQQIADGEHPAFREGDIVRGPFTVTGGVTSEGIGIVDSSVAEGEPHKYVPVRVIRGNRNSGGYLPSDLTLIDIESM